MAVHFCYSVPRFLAYSNSDLTKAKSYTYIDSRDEKEKVTLRTTKLKKRIVNMTMEIKLASRNTSRS
jgi:GH15 family glucan-1,4-alpha-glucosidase